MKSILYKTITVALFLYSTTSFFNTSWGQDSIPAKKNMKNTVRINLTNPMIFGKDCFMLGYERTIGKHQSFSLSLGKFSFGKSYRLDIDSIKDVTDDHSSSGFHISGDYRFYLSKENKYDAPHGVYIGPYATYNSCSRNYKLTANTVAYKGDLYTKTRFGAATMGFQLGYQFIFWNRVTLDMILFGPGLGIYKYKAELDTNLDPDQEEELFRKINDAIKENIPGYSRVVDSGTFEKTGSYNTTGMGFRYVVMLGFRF